MPKKIKAILIPISLVITGLLAAFIAAEIVLRLAGVDYPVWYVPDRITGMSLLPNADVWQRQEGQARIQTSSAGLRDIEHSVSKPAATFRIALLGDSYAEAVQLPLEQTFWNVFRQKIASHPAFADRQVEILNFGVSGFSTAQEYLTLKHRVLAYSPDLVLLAFTSGNDIRDNSRALDRDSNVPYFILEDGRLSADNSFLNSPSFKLRDSSIARCLLAALNYSRVLQLANEYRRVSKADSLRKEPSPVPSEPGLDLAIYQPPNDLVWSEAWRVTEALLQAMKSEAAEHQAGFIIAVLSNPVQVNPDPTYRSSVAAKLGVTDLFYPEERLSSFGRNNNIPVITLAPLLRDHVDQELKEGKRVYLHGFGNNLGGGHWNALGHRLAGEYLAEAIGRTLGK